MQKPSRLDQATEKDAEERRNKKNTQMASSQEDEQKQRQGRMEAWEVANGCHLDEREERS